MSSTFTLSLSILCYLLFTNQTDSLSEFLRENAILETGNTTMEATREIVSSCLIKNFTTVGIAGNNHEVSSWFPEFSDSVTMTLVGSSRPNDLKVFSYFLHSLDVFIKNRGFAFLHQLHAFVTTANSSWEFRKVLGNLKTSMWWNHDGLYLIVEKIQLDDGCKNPYAFLLEAWYRNILFCVYLCQDPTEGTIMFTYNPYNRYMPGSWKLYKEYRGAKGHPWIMYKQKYVPGTINCNELFYDKCTDLGNLTMRADVVKSEPTLSLEKIYNNSTQSYSVLLKGVDGEFSKTLMRKLKATATIYTYPLNNLDELGFIDETGKSHGILSTVVRGESDMILNSIFLITEWSSELTYPHSRSGICIMTSRRGYLSQLEKILHFMTWRVLLLILLVFLIIYTVLVILVGQGYFAAFLKTLKLFLSISIKNVPPVNSVRMFLITGFSMALVMNAIVQGNLASLLSIDIQHQNVETIEDLKRLGMTIRGIQLFKKYIHDEELQKSFVEEPTDVCVNHLAGNFTGACVSGCTYMTYNFGSNPNLYISRTQVHEFYDSHILRNDWPFIRRTNILIQTMVETGLLAFWKEHMLWPSLVRDKTKVSRDEFPPKRSKVLSLDDLAFAFYILTIGYSCAILAFLYEINAEIKIWLRKTRRYFRSPHFLRKNIK